MGNVETAVTLERIHGIVRQILDRFHPTKIILFGSYAQGEPTEDSDVDLLVVMETEEPPLHAAARISSAVDHPLPLDIIVITPSELEASLQRRGIFATQVTREGTVLYEA
jgi:predicted nucleotidyltransferase